MTDGLVRVVVQSRRVPARTICMTEPVYSTSGLLMGSRTNTLVVYDEVFDEIQRKAIDEGRRLSRTLGLGLEVVDRSKSGILRRVLSVLGSGGSSRINVVVSPSTDTKPSAPMHLNRQAPA